jgi:zinc transporter, ZIP family
MLESFALGAVTQLSLVLSGLAVFLVTMPRRLVGAMAAFGAGALIAAVARDLLPEAHVLQLIQSSLWAMIGASVFIIAEHQVHKKFGSDGASGALGIVVGSVVDGVPESIIFGIQLASGEPVSVAFMVAVFVSNIPQAIAPSADLVAVGWNGRRVATLWLWVVLACGIASVLGYVAGGVFTATGETGRFSTVSGARWECVGITGYIDFDAETVPHFVFERRFEAGRAASMAEEG